MPSAKMTDISRSTAVAHALRLEYLTVGWNIVEGLVAVAAAHSAQSVALLGFGIDSFVECLSGGILIWRLHAERAATDRCAIERLDRRAHKMVAVSLLVLAAYIMLNAAWSLREHERPRPSLVGLALTTLSLVVMRWLAHAKRRAAASIGSRALEADAFQTTACWWLSLVTVIGLGLNAIAGWWWADPVAALGIAFFVAKEGHAAWRGQDCCQHSKGTGS